MRAGEERHVESETERGRKGDRGGVCVRVCVREREFVVYNAECWR